MLAIAFDFLFLHISGQSLQNSYSIIYREQRICNLIVSVLNFEIWQGATPLFKDVLGQNRVAKGSLFLLPIQKTFSNSEQNCRILFFEMGQEIQMHLLFPFEFF
jgi:hypothetical protein